METKGKRKGPRGSTLAMYLPSSQVPMNEVQVLQIPHARRDLRRHVDETVETETTTKRREFPATKLRCSHFANPPDHRRRRRDSKGFLRGAGRRENPQQLWLLRRSRLINASNSRRRNLLRANSSGDSSSEMKPSPGSSETIAALREP